MDIALVLLLVAPMKSLAMVTYNALSMFLFALRTAEWACCDRSLQSISRIYQR